MLVGNRLRPQSTSNIMSLTGSDRWHSHAKPNSLSRLTIDRAGQSPSVRTREALACEACCFTCLCFSLFLSPSRPANVGQIASTVATQASCGMSVHLDTRNMGRGTWRRNSQSARQYLDPMQARSFPDPELEHPILIVWTVHYQHGPECESFEDGWPKPNPSLLHGPICWQAILGKNSWCSSDMHSIKDLDSAHHPLHRLSSRVCKASKQQSRHSSRHSLKASKHQNIKTSKPAVFCFSTERTSTTPRSSIMYLNSVLALAPLIAYTVAIPILTFDCSVMPGKLADIQPC